ncbi:amidohydrolase family protein [Streptomyces acidiscabies]|uniref:Amidohydrolase n=1 Tax=Streptomyces acidiscabies TaxID=42234 RepID=A0A0L0K624_9ACTN|nr:amidohydrolase family protein [Streptomyces acidiscabies]KND33129.1 amidohydrolase [Streptomyces acidiscabies]
MRLPRRNLLTAAAAVTAAVPLSASPASAGGPRTPPKGRRILIRGGHVIDTEPQPVARADTDVLVDGGRIVAVGRGLRAAGAAIIDATGHIVLPGFVDTHRHVWQSALRSASVDTGLDAYFGLLHRVGPRFRPQDVHIATLAGALECLDAGITTQLDFAHIAYSPDLADAAVDALEEAGLRAVFGYGIPVDVTGGGNLADDTALVTMAYAPLGPLSTPMDTVARDWRIADELDLPLTIHLAAGPANEHPVTALRDAGLLRRKTLYAHPDGIGDDELKLIADSGATAAATPGDMFSTMRAAHLAGQPGTTAADVLRTATLDGAAALGLADRIGSLRPGKQADLVLLRLDDLNLLTAERDPVAAVVMAAQPHNVDTVLVAGRVVKSGGRLLHADVRRTARALRATAAAVTGRR